MTAHLPRRQWLRQLLALSVAALAGGHLSAGERSRPHPSEKLTVNGQVRESRVFTVHDLTNLPTSEASEVDVICQSGANKGRKERLRGVPLKVLLEHVGLVADHALDYRRMMVIARGTDDYRVVFSWGELFNAVDGEHVLVYFLKDGLPLNDDEGRIALIPTADTRSGARQVKWLDRIEVRRIDD